MTWLDDMKRLAALKTHKHTYKILRLRFFYLSHTRLYREYITSSEMYSLHFTHPKWTHTRSRGQPCYGARGAVGGSVPCSRTPQSWYWGWRERWLFTPYNPCRTWDSNPQPLDYKSNSLTIRPRLPQYPIHSSRSGRSSGDFVHKTHYFIILHTVF